jgi:hypothetical protein
VIDVNRSRSSLTVCVADVFVSVRRTSNAPDVVG